MRLRLPPASPALASEALCCHRPSPLPATSLPLSVQLPGPALSNHLPSSYTLSIYWDRNCHCLKGIEKQIQRYENCAWSSCQGGGVTHRACSVLACGCHSLHSQQLNGTKLVPRVPPCGCRLVVVVGWEGRQGAGRKCKADGLGEAGADTAALILYSLGPSVRSPAKNRSRKRP